MAVGVGATVTRSMDDDVIVTFVGHVGEVTEGKPAVDVSHSVLTRSVLVYSEKIPKQMKTFTDMELGYNV